MAEPRRFITKYYKNTDVSIAAGATETILDQDTQGVLKGFYVTINEDNGTGLGTGVIAIEIDGTTVFSEYTSDIDRYYNQPIGTDIITDLPHCIIAKWDDTNNDYAYYIRFNTEVTNNLTIKYTNSDTTNAAIVRGVWFVDREI
jgi:hypothetical protein